MHEVNDNIRKNEEELQLLGQPLPVDDNGKLNIVWNMLSEFCETYKNVLKGKYDIKRISAVKDEGGYKIKAKFKNLLEQLDYEIIVHWSNAELIFLKNANKRHNLNIEFEPVQIELNEILVNANPLQDISQSVVINDAEKRISQPRSVGHLFKDIKG